MGNCLVTKLKGVVDNGSLLKLGEVKFHVLPTAEASGQDFNLAVHFYQIAKVYVKSGTFDIRTHEAAWTTGVTEFTCQASTQYELRFPDGVETDLYVENKYEVFALYFGNRIALDVADIKFCTKITSISTVIDGNVTGDIKNLENLQMMQTFNLDMSKVYGDIEVFGRMPNLAYINVGNIPGIYGNLSSLDGRLIGQLVLAGCTKVQGSILSLGKNTYNCGYYMYNMPNVTGAIEDLAAALVANGARNISQMFNIGDSGITYQGQPVGVVKITIDANGNITYSDN